MGCAELACDCPGSRTLDDSSSSTAQAMPACLEACPPHAISTSNTAQAILHMHARFQTDSERHRAAIFNKVRRSHSRPRPTEFIFKRVCSTCTSTSYGGRTSASLSRQSPSSACSARRASAASASARWPAAHRASAVASASCRLVALGWGLGLIRADYDITHLYLLPPARPAGGCIG